MGAHNTWVNYFASHNHISFAANMSRAVYMTIDRPGEMRVKGGGIMPGERVEFLILLWKSANECVGFNISFNT